MVKRSTTPYRAVLRALLFAALMFVAPSARAEDPLLPTPDLVARLLPTMVRIETRKVTKVDGVDGKPATFTEKPSFGSGFIIEADGIILTNWHVIASSREITVILDDNTRLKAEVLYRAPIDLAVLKVKAPSPLPVVIFGDSDKVRRGDTAIAIGNPLGVGVTVTKGIVSAINKGLDTSIWDDFIQIDAALNQGNSGGPLFNDRGELIGVDSALITTGDNGGSVGLGFAIPANDVLYILERWRQYGRVRTGWLGADLANVTPDIALAWGMAKPNGVVIVSVPAGTAAAEAGLLPGDIIVRIGTSEVTSARTVYRAFGGAPIGGKLDLTVERQAQRMLIPTSVGEAPRSITDPPAEEPLPAEIKADQRRDLGLTLARVTDKLRKDLKIASPRDGLVVTAVAPNSVAALGGIHVGSLIIAVQQFPATTPEAFLERLDEARKLGRRRVFLVFADKASVRWSTYSFE